MCGCEAWSGSAGGAGDIGPATAAGSPCLATEPAVVAQQLIGAVPMRRCGRMEEIAGAVAFLLGDDANDVTGVHAPVAGGVP